MQSAYTKEERRDFEDKIKNITKNVHPSLEQYKKLEDRVKRLERLINILVGDTPIDYE